jgi:hypothetical protein
MKGITSLVLAVVAVAMLPGAPPAISATTCGNGIVEGGEECDPGGGLFCNGDPSLPSCTTGAQCDGGVNCYFVTSCCKFNCQFVGQGATCFDGNSCTADDRCDNVGRCLGQFQPDGAACDDGVFCNGADTCAAGDCDDHAGDPCTASPDCLATCDENANTCVSTPFVPCGDDGNACTDDVCNGSGTCTHPPHANGTVCRAAATVCDVDESCDGTAAPCPADGFVPNGTSCGDACTTGGTCQTGQCSAGTPVVCDDANACNGVETCDSNLGCQPGTPLNCSDGESCTADPCDPLAGCSQHIPQPDGASCDDADACTALDVCRDDVCVGGPTFLGQKKAKVVNDVTINRWLAAWDVKGIATIGRNGFMPDGTAITGDRVKLGPDSSVFDVQANLISSRGAVIRGSTSAVTVPLSDEFCQIPTFVCGGPDVQLLNLEVQTLNPGSYGNLRVGEGAILNLKPGDYTFCSFVTGRNVQVNFLGSVSSLIRVDRRFVLGNGSTYLPAAAVPTPRLHGASGLIKFGADALVRTHVTAPAAKVKVQRSTIFDGAICALELKGAWHVTLSCTE